MFENEKFDFVFTTLFDEVPSSDLFVAEIERVLKHGGIAAMHVSLDVWHNKFLSSKGGGVKPVTLLFHHSNMVYVARAEASGLDTIIVFKKNSLHLHRGEEDKPLASERAIIWPCMSAINTGSYLELGKFKGKTLNPSS
jgi:SAM-dependent methyltransferase